MKPNFRIAILLVCAALCAATKGASAQEFDDQGETGIYGYTSIDFDPNTNMVTAYSETDLYGSSTYYYQAQVQLTSNGQEKNAEAPTPYVTSVNASLSYQGTAGTTYTAYGQHSAFISLKYFGATYNDIYGLELWADYDIIDPWEFPFTSFTEESSDEDEIQLGTTYDSASATIPANCGDERTTIIQEYVTKKTPYFPQCSEFVEAITDPTFTFAQLNYGQYDWAILRSYFLTDIDQLAALTTFTINSAYRNPVKEASVSGTTYHPGSRHQYGDALDVASNASTWSGYQAYGHQLKACVEPTSVQGGSTAHTHLDWRTQATVGPHYSSCPPKW